MDIEKINFGAIPKNKTSVKKFNKVTKRFVNYPVYFVKLDKYNKNDLDAIDKTAQKWKDTDYIKDINTSSHWMQFKPIEVYALTSQQNNFENLKADYILGLAEIRNNKNNSNLKILNHIQVRPNAINVNQTNKLAYKHVGSAILESLKKIYKDISLVAVEDDNVYGFYKRNGFIDDFNGSRHFQWSSNIFKRAMLRIAKFRREYGI